MQIQKGHELEPQHRGAAGVMGVMVVVVYLFSGGGSVGGGGGGRGGGRGVCV